MIDQYTDHEAAANRLKRRWFSSLKAVRAQEEQCEVLREVLELAESDWRRARHQLAELEGLRDAWRDQLTEIDGQYAGPASRAPLRRAIVSAA